MNEERLLSMGARLKDDNTRESGVSFVHVPSDSSWSLQELVLVSSSLSSSSMEAFFQNYFALQPGESVDMALVQDQADQARQCTTYMCPHVSPLTLQRAAAEGTVQRSLLSEDDEMGKIFLYYDEGAALKRRRKNERACRFVTGQQGQVDEEIIHGDVFLTRLKDGQSKSLDMAELSTHTWFSE